MSPSPGPRFRPNGFVRRVIGPIFGMACLLATCTGVAVLFLLLGSILAAASKGHRITLGMRSAKTSAN